MKNLTDFRKTVETSVVSAPWAQHKAEALLKDNNIRCPFEHEMTLFYSHNLLQLSLLIKFNICVGLMAKLVFVRNKLLNYNYLCFK